MIEELKKFLSVYDITQQSLAEKTGYNQANLNTYLVGHKKITRRVFLRCIIGLIAIARERKVKAKQLDRELSKLIEKSDQLFLQEKKNEI